jgi:hypothetical protein
MNYMAQFALLVNENLHYIILVMALLILVALIIFMTINFRLAKLNRRYQQLMQGVHGENLEKVLLGHIEEVRQAITQVDSLTKDVRRLDGILRGCVQRVGIVRFNAFEDTGSDLSFAVVMLDAEYNGVVISSLFGRNDSRTYAKPIIRGESSYFLTTEEKQALQKAKENIPK